MNNGLRWVRIVTKNEGQKSRVTVTLCELSLAKQLLFSDDLVTSLGGDNLEDDRLLVPTAATRGAYT